MHNTVTGQWRSQITDADSISQRPAEAGDRAIPGHWEGDLLCGRHWTQVGTVVDPASRIAVANRRRAGRSGRTDNLCVDRKAYPGFLITGAIENGATGCQAADGCPDDTHANPIAIAGHTASDVPLSADGPGAWQFTGVFENTDVFVKLLRASTGAYPRVRQ